MANLVNTPCLQNKSTVMMCELCKTIFKTQELFENHLRQESHLVKLKSVPGLCRFCKICKLHFYYNVITKHFEDHKNSPAHIWTTAITVFGNHKVIASLFWLKPGPPDELEINSDFLGTNYIVKCMGKGEDYYICYLCGFSPKIDSCCNEYSMEDPLQPLIIHHLQSKWHLRNLVRVHAPRNCKMFDKLYAEEENYEIYKMGHFSKVKQSKIVEKVKEKISKFIPPHLFVSKRICYLNINDCLPDYDMIVHVTSISNKILTEVNLHHEDKGEAIKILKKSIKEQFHHPETSATNLGFSKKACVVMNTINNESVRSKQDSSISCVLHNEKARVAPNLDDQPFVFPTTAIEDMVVLDEISTIATTSTHGEGNNLSFESGVKELHGNSLDNYDMRNTLSGDEETPVNDMANFTTISIDKEAKPNFYVRSKIGKDGKRTVIVKKICKPKYNLYSWKRPGYTPPKHVPLTITTNVNAEAKDRVSEVIYSASKRAMIRTLQAQKNGPEHLNNTISSFGNNSNDPQATSIKPDNLPFGSSPPKVSQEKLLVNIGNQRLLNEVLNQVQQYVPGMPSVDMTKEDFTKESTIWRLLDVVSNIIKTLVTKPFDKNKLMVFFDKLQTKYCKSLKVDNCYLHNLLRGILIVFSKDPPYLTGSVIGNHEAFSDIRGFNNFPPPTSLQGSLMQPFPQPSFPPLPHSFGHYDLKPFPTGINPLISSDIPSSSNWFDKNSEMKIINSTLHGTSHGKSRSKERSHNHYKKHRRYRSRRHRSRQPSKSSEDDLYRHRKSSRISSSTYIERHQESAQDNDQATSHQVLEKGKAYKITGKGDIGVKVDASNKSLEEMPDERCLLQRSLITNRLKQLIELQKQALTPNNGNDGNTDDSMSIAVHLQTRLNDIVSDPANASALHGHGGADVKGLLQEALRTQVQLLEKNNDRMRVMESSHTRVKEVHTTLASRTSAVPTYAPGVSQASLKNNYTSKLVPKTSFTQRYFTVDTVSKPSSIGSFIPVHQGSYKREDVTKNFNYSSDTTQKQGDVTSHIFSGNPFYDNRIRQQLPPQSAFNYPPPVYNPTPLINRDYREGKDVIPNYYTDKSIISSNPSVYDPNPNLTQYFTNLQRQDNANKFITTRSGTFQNFYK